MLVLVALLLINFWVLKNTVEPPELVHVKEKYSILRKHLREENHVKFKKIWRAKPVTGFTKMRGDTVGYNTNKGEDIALCLDGTPNEIFHVLIHELAHCTVDTYSHSKEFWSNYIELRDMCINLGLYEKIPANTKFCGQHISDE